MNPQYRFRQVPAGNPIANLLIVLAGIFVISVAITIGFFVFLAVTGFVLVVAVAVGIRHWWQRRRIVKSDVSGREPTAGEAQSRQVIEGEYFELRVRDKRREER